MAALRLFAPRLSQRIARGPRAYQDEPVEKNAARDIAFDRELDVRGFTCPVPALRARIALGRLQSGQVLKVVATDPGSPRDFRNFAKATGHALLSQRTAGKDFVFYLRKS